MRKLLTLLAVVAIAACGRQTSPNMSTEATCVQNELIQVDDGVTLSADCYPGAGPTLVFVHGAFQSRVVWAKQVAALAGKYRVISYDLRGHGDSDKPKTEAAYANPWVPAKDLTAILDHFDISKAVLIGWSFGSIVAADAAAFLGEDRVAGLVLVSGTIESATQRNRDNFGPLAGETDAERFISNSFVAGEWDPTLYQHVLAANQLLSAEQRALVVKRPTQSYAEAIASARYPVLLVHGDADNVFSVESSRAAHADLPNSELIEYPNTGHWPFLEQSERFNADIARFVNILDQH